MNPTQSLFSRDSGRPALRGGVRLALGLGVRRTRRGVLGTTSTSGRPSRRPPTWPRSRRCSAKYDLKCGRSPTTSPVRPSATNPMTNATRDPLGPDLGRRDAEGVRDVRRGDEDDRPRSGRLGVDQPFVEVHRLRRSGSTSACSPATSRWSTPGYQDFADRWNPILDASTERPSPTRCTLEIAYDYWRRPHPRGRRPPESFGLNWDPSHFVWQDPTVSFLWTSATGFYTWDCKDTKLQSANGRNGRLGSTSPGPTPGGWTSSPRPATSRGNGGFRMLNTIGTKGPISVEVDGHGLPAWCPDALSSGVRWPRPSRQPSTRRSRPAN